jgi:predicted transcriptional regulator
LKRIQELIFEWEDEGLKSTEIAMRLGVSQPMVSTYKKDNGNVNLGTALYVFKEYNICLHPFAEESLVYELNKNNELSEEQEDEDTDI